jgi:glycerol-3-phosphate dehydrogenase (NAD(P)+)
MKIPEDVSFTIELSHVCTNKDFLLFAVPSVYIRSTARQACPYIMDKQIIVDVAKGIEADTLMTMSEVISEEIPQAKVVC